MTPQARELSRYFFANAQETGAGLGGPRDAARRASWRTPGSPRASVIVAGTGACLELWDRATWQTYDATLTRARA